MFCNLYVTTLGGYPVADPREGKRREGRGVKDINTCSTLNDASHLVVNNARN